MTRGWALPKPTRWEREVDPDEVLPPAERYRRADALRAAFYIEQGLKARERNRNRKALAADGAGDREPAPAKIAEERRLRGRMGGLIRSSRGDPRAMTAAARSGADARFERLVDPDGTLAPAERARRAAAARQAHFASMLLRSIEARDGRRRRSGSPVPDGERRRATRQSIAGRIGAFTMLATHDPSQTTVKARQAAEARWDRLADPDHQLAEEERAARVRALKSNYYRALAQRRHAAGGGRRLLRGRPEGT
jgi:hypothetical protein